MGLLARLRGLQKRWLIGPTSPQNPAYWLTDIFGGRDSAAGIRINETNALSWTPLLSGVRFLAETMAALPLRVYRRDVEGRSKVQLFDHPIARLVRNGPNPEETWFEFLELMMIHVVLWGNAYAQIVWSGAGEPLELWPMNPDRVTMRRDANGMLVYQVMLPAKDLNVTGQFTTLPAENVLHIRGFSRWGLLGESIATVSREAIGLGLATEEFATRFFGSGANAGGILSHPGELSKPARERIEESVQQQVGGLSRAHRTLILEEGMTWQQVTIEPEKAQFLGVRNFQVLEASRILRIPPHLLYQLDRATFTNIEHQGIELVVYTLVPWAKRIEARLEKQLVSTKMSNTVYTKFALEGLLRGDTTNRYAAYASGRNAGWLSVNDIRELEDMNPVQDGDTYLQPANMVPLGTEPAPPKLPAAQPMDTQQDVPGSTAD